MLTRNLSCEAKDVMKYPLSADPHPSPGRKAPGRQQQVHRAMEGPPLAEPTGAGGTGGFIL